MEEYWKTIQSSPTLGTLGKEGQDIMRNFDNLIKDHIDTLIPEYEPNQLIGILNGVVSMRVWQKTLKSSIQIRRAKEEG